MYEQLLSETQKSKKKPVVVIKKLNFNSIPKNVNLADIRVKVEPSPEPAGFLSNKKPGFIPSPSPNPIEIPTVKEERPDNEAVLAEKGTKRECIKMLDKIDTQVRVLRGRVAEMDDKDTDLLPIFQALLNSLDELGSF